jgi:nicotinamidase-related amidase
MAVRAHDPKTTLPIAELQKGIIGSPFIHPIGEVVECARALTDAFRGLGLPVVLVNVAGGAPGRTEQPRHHDGPFPADFTDFVVELGHRPHDIVVTKQRGGAFAGTDLEAQLEGRSVTAAIATGTGAEATARQGYEQEFNATLAIGAMTDVHPEAHDYRLRRGLSRLGETGTAQEITAQEIIDLLSTRSA